MKLKYVDFETIKPHIEFGREDARWIDFQKMPINFTDATLTLEILKLNEKLSNKFDLDREILVYHYKHSYNKKEYCRVLVAQEPQ